MSIKVRLVDKENDEIIYDGNAHIENEMNKKIITFGTSQHQFCWKIFDDGLVIESVSEVSVLLTLRKNRMTKGHIDSEFGRIDLKCWTSIYTMYENYIKVVYDLIQDNQRQTFNFELYIYKEDVHAIH